MEKNKKVFILVGELLLVIGVSFAYFMSTTLFGGNGSDASGQTAVINGATIKVEGSLAFNDLDILPGHKTVSELKLTATGDNENIIYNLIWNGSNNLNTPLNFTVYKSKEKIETNATCEKKTKVENGAQILKEDCTISNIDSLGSIISSGTINEKSENTKVILKENESITATSTGELVYYYIVLEYPNLEENQNEDIGGTFNGTVTVEESNIKADITIAKVYIDDVETTEIPKKNSGYGLNTEKSTCTNNAQPTWNKENWSLQVKNLSTSGTDCNLYFEDKSRDIKPEIIASAKSGTPDFSAVATTDEGVYKAQDNDDESYYFRGAVTNNYVKFANKWWRIIRINGDGSIRLIYDGTSGHQNGEETTDSIAIASQKFSHKDAYYNTSTDNAFVKDNAYVGFKYTVGELHGLGTKSNALVQLETWYQNNLSSYASKIATNAGFCGDRTPSTSGSSINNTGGTGTTLTYYAGYIRLATNKTPALICTNSSDLYTVNSSSKGNKSLTYPIGLITADEVSMAGGVFEIENSSYYLYNGQFYWMLTPSYFSGLSARMLVVLPTGNVLAYLINNPLGLRPVINLKDDTKFTGTGTLSDPYTVVD